MAIYYFIFLALSVLVFIECINSSYSLYFNWIITFFFIVFVGIRYGVGNDYFVYYDNFKGIRNGTDTSADELLYLVLNKMFPFEFGIFFFSFFSFFFLKKTIDYFSPKHSVLSYFIFYSFFLILFEIHIIRQGLAISLVLYSYKYLFNKKYVVFILFVLVASAFHKSALIVLPCALILNFIQTTILQFILVIFSLIVFFFQGELILIYYNFASQIPILNAYLLVYRMEETTSYGFSSGMLLDVIIFIILLINSKTFNEKELFLFRIFVLSIVLTFILSLDPAALRLTYYFRTVVIFLIPLFFKFKSIKWLSLVLIILVCYQYLNTTFSSISEFGRGDRNLKYYTIFNKSNYKIGN
jgi:hypothetical protein